MRNFLLLMAVMLWTATGLQAQDVDVSGVVSGEAGEPIPGVNVLVQGTTIGTVTDIDGQYRLRTSEDAEVLSTL